MIPVEFKNKKYSYKNKVQEQMLTIQCFEMQDN